MVISILRPEFAVFGLLMAVAGVVSMAVSIVGEHARRRRGFAEFTDRVTALDTELRSATGRQTVALREVSPDDATLRAIVTERRPRLWERRAADDDALSLRVGTGTVRSLVRVEDRFMSMTGRHTGHEVDDIVRRYERLVDVPICTPHGSGRVVAAVGPAATTEPLIARMLLEAAALNPPDQLKITVLADTPAWSWARWLPHVADGGACTVSLNQAEANTLALRLTEQLDDQDQPRGGRPAANHLVVVVGNAAAATNVAELMRRGLPPGSQIIAAAVDANRLPGGVDTVVECRPDGTATMVGAQHLAPIEPFQVVGMPLAAAERLATEFAAIEVTAATAGASAGLVELATGTPLGALDVAASWRAAIRASPHRSAWPTTGRRWCSTSAATDPTG